MYRSEFQSVKSGTDRVHDDSNNNNVIPSMTKQKYVVIEHTGSVTNVKLLYTFPKVLENTIFAKIIT